MAVKPFEGVLGPSQPARNEGENGDQVQRTTPTRPALTSSEAVLCVQPTDNASLCLIEGTEVKVQENPPKTWVSLPKCHQGDTIALDPRSPVARVR